MGVVAPTLAWASVVVGICVSGAYAGTVKLLPGDDQDGIAPSATLARVATPHGDPGFVLLNLAGKLVKWGGAGFGAGAVVRYAFVTAETSRSGAINCQTLIPIKDRLTNSSLRLADFAAEVRRAMDDWSAAANVEFRRVEDPAAADLLIGGDKDPHGIAYTDVQRGDGIASGVAAIAHAAVCFNLDLAWEDRFDGDSSTPNVRYVAAHELGHALGLDHAWGKDKIMRFQYEERFYVPQRSDLAGAAFLYGARPSPAGLALIQPLTAH